MTKLDRIYISKEAKKAFRKFKEINESDNATMIRLLTKAGVEVK